MKNTFYKIQSNIAFTEFLDKIKLVKEFSSSTGKRYSVIKIVDEILYFVRLDAQKDVEWQMDLRELYRAFNELDDFVTKNFKPYVPRTHSPARGLLIKVGLLCMK